LEVFFIVLFRSLLIKDINRIYLELFLTFFSFLIIIFNFFPSLEIILEIELEDKIYSDFIIINIFGYQWY
jgi:heme/copper-type cytochrome/quinol oxidase subunit 2